MDEKYERPLLRSIVDFVLDRLGMELVRSKAPRGRINRDGKFVFAPVRRTMEEAMQHMVHLGFAPSFIVDVGAGKGTQALLRTWPKTPTHWVEPLKEFVPQLRALASRYPGKYTIAAAGNNEGRSNFNVHDNPFGSSLLSETDGARADGQPREVHIVRLDDLIDHKAAGSEVLLKVDVQGAELQVLNGAPELLKQCEAVVLEVNFFQLHKGSPEFTDVVVYMKERGFVAYDIFNGHNRPLDDALAQRDVLFVRENGRFRAQHGWSSQEQRERYFMQ
jgi:FkbM family methyltransferase